MQNARSPVVIIIFKHDSVDEIFCYDFGAMETETSENTFGVDGVEPNLVLKNFRTFYLYFFKM